MTPALQLMLGLGTSPPAAIEDVFSAFTYTGNGGAQALAPGIDLAGKGGLAWFKQRAGAGANNYHNLVDSARGIGNLLVGNTTAAEIVQSTVTSFDSAGVTMGAFGPNAAANDYIGWLFRKAAKFFDIVTWTGNGTAAQTINHNLGVVPGMIIVKNRTTAGFSWFIWHRSMGQNTVQLESAAAMVGDPVGINFGSATLTAPTAAAFTVGSNGAQAATNYVAYLFAHDAAATGMIQCGSIVTNGSPQTINLGWEPQFIFLRNISTGSHGFLCDVSRSLTADITGFLSSDTTTGDSGVSALNLAVNASGIKINQAADTWIYMAIRRGPMKAPTTGTQVYNAIARTGTSLATIVTGAGFPPDLVCIKGKSFAGEWSIIDRLRDNAYLNSDSTTTETAVITDIPAPAFDVMDGFREVGNLLTNSGGSSYINYCFRRSPKTVDVVCYSGTGAVQSVAHNLGAIPELIFVKRRDSVSAVGWLTYIAALGNTSYVVLNSTAAVAAGAVVVWNSATPTASVFSVGNNADVDAAGGSYVAYLFASFAGISKVGSYVGNGTSQTINCSFAAGARFVLIKRTDAVGDWFVWDTVRGIIAANDPHLSFNTNASEVITDDSIDPDASGFIVNQVAATNINVNAANYIFLAFA